jgi:Flp pilus assembly protein TadD
MMFAADAYDQAYVDYATAVKLDRTDPGALAELVRAAVAARRDRDAAGLLKALIDDDPKDTRARIALSKLQAGTGAIDEALATAVDASRIEPTDPDAVIQLASLYADVGDAARLGPVVDLLQRRFAGRPETHYYSAAASFLQGQLQTALGQIQQVIAQDPKRPDAHNMLGAIQASQGRSDEARRAFETALELDPRGSATYTNLGLLELSNGNRSRAAGLFAEALSLDPASQAARSGLEQSSDPFP